MDQFYDEFRPGKNFETQWLSENLAIFLFFAERECSQGSAYACDKLAT